MNRWFGNLIANFNAWMYGRYGYDELSKILSISALVFMVLSFFVPVMYLVALACLIWSVFRTYSKNTAKRYSELQKYLSVKNKCKRFFSLRKTIFRERKNHKYYKCPRCKAYLRVPKGRGKIEISCPKCRNSFIKTT